METLEQLRQQLTNDLKNSFLKRASDTDSNRKPLDVIGEVSLMLATNIADYSEKLLREIVTPGYVTDEYDKRYTLLTTFNAHESNLRDAKHITKEQLDVINLVTSWFGFDPDENAVYVKNKYNFYAEGGVSAKGFSAGGSGGGGGMDEELLWSILGDGDNPNKQIALSHLDTLLKNISNTYYTKQQIQANYLTASEISAKYISKDAFPKIFSDEMAKWFKKDEDGNIYAEVNFYSTQGISAKGLGSGSGGGGGMDEELLWAILGDGENPDKQIAISHLSTTLSNYATHTWVTDKHYATEAWVTAKKYATIDWVNETFVKKADYTDLWLAEMDKWFKKDDSGNIYTEVNFYSNKGVSAKGLDASGGGGGGMDEELLWSILGDGENPNKQIALTHLTTALSGYYTSTQVNSAINDAVKYYIPISQKGVAGGVAPLGSDGLISSSFLPSYVDDVLEFASLSAFPSTGESGKIYIAVDTNLTYRWSGTQYVEVSKSLALGETESTAYAGNKGAANRADIDKLKRATFWGASYQSDGNVYGTFTGTKIILSDLIETPKIKIGDAFIEYDAERTALKVVRYLADGTETVASLYATGGISARGFSPSGGGGGGGAGSISLNGTLYESVDGVITLPNLKLAEPTTFALHENYVSVRTAGRTSNQYYEFWDTNAGWAILAAKGFKTAEGTASQFLKADGSLDGNLYALAYEGNQNKVQYSRHTDYLKTVDRRNQVYTPNIIENSSLSAYFTIQDTPYSNWRSTISVKGWSSDYATWELTGPSHNDDTKANERLYYRYGFNSSWKTGWKPLAFLEDISNVADVYFNGQNIYSDYGHWVVGLIRIGTADIGDKYISGEMIYRRSNGIYANGSVRFNLIKKYQTTSMFAGVLYVGYGINTDQDAPRLCTFTYQGVKWGGLCWRSAASLNSIKTIIYDNSSTDTPFYVRYYNSQSGEVQNTEINNSISVLGSDIDIFPISSNGKFYTSSGRMDIHSAGNDWAYMRYTTDGRFYDIGLSSSRNSDSAMNGETGNFEIRPNGSSNGIFVRYSNSSYGRLGVVSRSTQECSISYWNNAPTSNYPLWTVGAGIRNQYSFDWYYHNQGYKATLDSEGKLFVNVRVAGNPYCSLTIGDYDTGLSWVSDGVIEFRSNAKQVGYWGYTNGRLFNCYFREPSGVTYDKASLMINGNGSNISPSIGFHQPGVVGCNLRVDNGGNFLFEDASNYKNVYAYNFVAAGWLYSTANSCEVRIGSQNASYVHITNNKSRPYYMDNRLDISGHVIPYSANIYDLGESGKPWRQAYIINMHGSADAAGMLNPAYIGGQQPNPQTYFGSGTGLKVAMTGVYTNGAYWSDTLWVNGYYGDDVPRCTALHFPRDGSAEMYISSQETKSTNYGAVYRIWSSRNSNKSDVDWVCKGLSAHARIGTTADIYSAGWIRAGGTNGFYCESYGGGWHMTDSTWIRAYNNKQIYTASTSPDAFHTLGGVNASGRIYAGSYIETHGGLVCAGVGNSGGASGFNVYASFYGNGQHGGIEIGASDNVFGIGVHSNDHMYWWWTNAGSIGSSSNKSYIMDYGGGSWSFTGNILATGGITAKTTSDMRLKNKIGNSNYIEKLLSLGPVFDYTYNDIAKSRVGKMVDNEIHTGLSYQDVSKLFPTMCGVDEDGYGYINYISPDFISLIAGAVQMSILNIKDLYNKQKTIYDNLEDALKRIEELEKRLGLIA